MCITNSWAISKKKLLEQRDTLVARIMSEYQFQTDFKGISNKLHNEFDSVFAKIMSKVSDYKAGQYRCERLGPPNYLHIPNEKEVDEFRIKLICTNYYKAARDEVMPFVLMIGSPNRKYWDSEWNTIELLYPEVTELNKKLNKKKCSTIIKIVYANWISNFDLTTPSTRDLVEQYNQKEKEEVRNRYKQWYESEQASKANEERLRKANEERLRKERAAERARQKQIQREQAQQRWADDSWLGGGFGWSLDTPYGVISIYIDTDKQTIEQYFRPYNNNPLKRSQLQYSGRYKIHNGTFDGVNCKMISFGDNVQIIAYPDYGKLRDGGRDGDYFRRTVF